MEYKGKKVYAIEVYLIDDFLKNHNLNIFEFAEFCGISEKEFFNARYNPEICDDDVFDKIFAATKIKPDEYFRFTFLPKLIYRRIKEQNKKK